MSELMENVIDITVLSLREARPVYSQFDIIVTTVDQEEIIRWQGAHHLVLGFDDVEYEDGYGPKEDHVKRILDHIETRLQALQLDRPAKVLIHCYAGISRSTAAAIASDMHFNNQSVESAFERIEKIRPILWPNLLVLKYFDDLHGHKTHDYCVAWKQKKKEQAGNGLFFVS